jgi:hypothetical protein
VLKHILKLDEIPGEEEFGFRRRCKDLRTKLLSMLDAAPIEVETSTERNSETSAEKQRAEAEVVGDGEYVQPAVCLTQLTPEQCNRIEEMAKACNPPLDRAVVELMCILPYFSTSAKYGGDRYQVAPQANLTRLPEKLDTIDRGFYPGGPTIPPHMLRLTNWPGRIGGLGTALFVDIRSGETLELRDFEDNASGEVCKTFEGPRRPVEDHLKEWIDNLLTMKWIPSGGDDIATDEWRSMVCIHCSSPFVKLIPFCTGIPQAQSTSSRIRLAIFLPTWRTSIPRVFATQGRSTQRSVGASPKSRRAALHMVAIDTEML